jgi:hypothetical protein
MASASSSSTKDPVEDNTMTILADVSSMFFSGLLLLILYSTLHSQNKNFFVITFSIYFALLNLYSLLYINQIKDTKMRASIHQRWLVYIYIYNMLLALFLVFVSIFEKSLSSSYSTFSPFSG